MIAHITIAVRTGDENDQVVFLEREIDTETFIPIKEAALKMIRQAEAAMTA